jgi:hypothetical protein
MLYIDEEARHVFHQTPALLQVICSILESHIASSGAQLELIDAEKRMGMWIAMVNAPDCSVPALRDAVDKINQAFMRKDDGKTCYIENEQARLLTVRVSGPEDFIHLN